MAKKEIQPKDPQVAEAETGDRDAEGRKTQAAKIGHRKTATFKIGHRKMGRKTSGYKHSS